jgi:hypothetical protein
VRAPKQHSQSDYDADMEATAGLCRLAGDHAGLSIIINHHDRKQDAADVFDTVSGTLGLQGGVDTIAILKKSSQNMTLHIKGRDLESDIEKAMQFDHETCRWSVLGEAAEVRRSDGRKAILDVLRGSSEGLTIKEIMIAVRFDHRNALDQMLWRMTRDGEIVTRGRGRYTVAPAEGA